jgi:hypothetical protein
VVVVVMVVMVVVIVEVVATVAVVATVVVIIVEVVVIVAPTEHIVMDQPIPQKKQNVIQMTTTVGDMAMIVLRSMTVSPARTDNRAIKKQHLAVIQWVVQSKIKNSQNGRIDGVGGNKQIILKRKRLTLQQK